MAYLKQVFGWVEDNYDKLEVEQAVSSDPSLPATILRLPMVYGPGDPNSRFLPWVKRIVDRPLAILLPSSVARWRGTKGFVENVAKAIPLATVSERAAGRVYNVGEADAPSELEWARLVAERMRYTGKVIVVEDECCPPHLVPPGNLSQHWVADTTHIRDELGYAEPVSRIEALGRTVAWQREHMPPVIDTSAFNYAAEDAALPSLADSPPNV
jgi:nucleoside-diphosphate-sugar epimerase